MLEASFVGVPGFEPGKAGPESAVLPLHHIPILYLFRCKGTAFLRNCQIFSKLFVYPDTKSALLSHIRCIFVTVG